MSDLRTELSQIYLRRGRLSPATVVEEATPPTHPLHNRFEWDDGVAGHKFRLVQARELIRSVKITLIAPDRDLTVRAFASVRSPAEPSNYLPTDELNDEQRAFVLIAMRRELDSLKRRYESYPEFWEYLDEQRPGETG